MSFAMRFATAVILLTASISFAQSSAAADPQQILDQLGRRNIGVHDPSAIVKCKDEYWIFYTGRGVPSYHSKDLVKWEAGPGVFTNALDWVAQAVPAASVAPARLPNSPTPA